MILHLNGREKALEAFGWTGRKAEWIALVCLHSGVFTRAQATRFLDTHHERARRMVHALIAQGLAAEETVPGIRGIGRVCRICARSLYRALGAEHIRHRRTASPDVVMRRLLSLDYVIEHTDLPWLPTEKEKVAAFEALGIERELLPVRRLYRGAAGDTRRYFPVKMPVALDSTAPCSSTPNPATKPRPRSGPGARRTGALARAHTARAGPSRPWPSDARGDETARARSVLHGWAEAAGTGESDPAIRDETRPDRAGDPFRARSRSSRSSAVCRLRSSGAWRLRTRSAARPSAGRYAAAVPGAQPASREPSTDESPPPHGRT